VRGAHSRAGVQRAKRRRTPTRAFDGSGLLSVRVLPRGRTRRAKPRRGSCNTAGGCHAACADGGMTRTDNKPLFRNRSAARIAPLDERARVMRASLTPGQHRIKARIGASLLAWCPHRRNVRKLCRAHHAVGLRTTRVLDAIMRAADRRPHHNQFRIQQVAPGCTPVTTPNVPGPGNGARRLSTGRAVRHERARLATMGCGAP
jgi:hypothetical protein